MTRIRWQAVNIYFCIHHTYCSEYKYIYGRYMVMRHKKCIHFMMSSFEWYKIFRLLTSHRVERQLAFPVTWYTEYISVALALVLAVSSFSILCAVYSSAVASHEVVFLTTRVDSFFSHRIFARFVIELWPNFPKRTQHLYSNLL